MRPYAERHHELIKFAIVGATTFVVDSAIFYPVAFLGAPGWPLSRVLRILFTNYALKVAWEVVATPLTYGIVGYLKRAEGEDYYDHDTDFTPFSLET